MFSPQNLRSNLKAVRDPNRTAYDYLPNGQTIGEFANNYAVARHLRKVTNKRERARLHRQAKKEQGWK